MWTFVLQVLRIDFPSTMYQNPGGSNLSYICPSLCFSCMYLYMTVFYIGFDHPVTHIGLPQSKAQGKLPKMFQLICSLTVCNNSQDTQKHIVQFRSHNVCQINFNPKLEYNQKCKSLKCKNTDYMRGTNWTKSNVFNSQSIYDKLSLSD